MAKKIVVDEAQLSRIVISGAGHGKNVFPVAPPNGDSFSPSLSRGRSGRHTEDEMTDEDVTDAAATEQTTLADIDGSASEELILLAKTDINLPPTPNTAPVTVVQKGIGLFGSNTSNWVAGGVGLAAVGTGVALSLNGTNDNPVSAISDSDVAANAVAENASNGTVVGITALATDAGATISYSLSDDAGGRFAIDATSGVITVADGSLLDYESATSHDITVLATSSDGSTSSQQFSINLSNVNDNPVSAISDSNVASNAVAENAATGTVVGITALATDADADTTISYSLSDNAGGRFAIDATSGVITVADGTLLDFEIATNHDLTVLATSSDGSTNSQQFTVDLSNVNEPVSSIKDSDVAPDAVVENAVNGTLVGITALAIDADAGTTISYSLSDNAGGRFAIDATSGIITVADGALLDTAIAPSHVVTVLATSSDGSINSQPFTIDVNAPPVLAIGASSVANNVPTGDLNLAGFGADDRIEIDARAFIANGDNALTDTGSGVSSENPAVYLSEGSLSFSQRATTTFFTGTVINIPDIATGTLQGGIASNADAMANNFQQVVFVTPII